MLLLWFLCLLMSLSGARDCESGQRPINVSTVLDSLRCYNDFKSHFHCTWTEEPERDPNKRPHLYFQKNNRRRLCQDQEAAEGTRQCRYNTEVFAYGSTYTAFFEDPLDLCSTLKSTRQDLPIRARTPSDLSISSTDDGGSLITWSSPYPQSPALNITYRVFYRRHGHNDWTAVELSDAHLKLDNKTLDHGQRYEATVSARVGPGPWSRWSPTVSWTTPLDPEQPPRVDCELWREGEALCSWEQSREHSHIISYELLCHHNHTDSAKECCKDPEVSLGHKEDTVKFSCRLPVTESTTNTLRVELVPKRNIWTFKARDYIRPNPPTDVNVTENGPNLEVTWTAEIPVYDLSHEVCYYSLPSEEDARTITSDHSSLSISRSSLLPSHRYWFKVRCRVKESREGAPSAWSHPFVWTPPTDSIHDVSVYVSLSVVVAVIILIVFMIPICRRRVVSWAESIPSPDKSKVILEIQTPKDLETVPREETDWNVLDVDSLSTCSTVMSPEQQRGPHSQSRDTEDESVWSCDNLPVSPTSFTGPYIFLLPTEEQISGQTEASCSGLGRAVLSSQSEEEYVRLPGPSASMSDLNHSCTDGPLHRETEGDTEEEQCFCNDYTTESFWPQEGDTESSGYCQLPAEVTQPQPD